MRIIEKKLSNEELISKLKYEIGKRDNVIKNLLEANERLDKALHKLVNVLGEYPEETLDHQITQEEADG